MLVAFYQRTLRTGHSSLRAVAAMMGSRTPGTKASASVASSATWGPLSSTLAAGASSLLRSRGPNAASRGIHTCSSSVPFASPAHGAPLVRPAIDHIARHAVRGLKPVPLPAPWTRPMGARCVQAKAGEAAATAEAATTAVPAKVSSNGPAAGSTDPANGSTSAPATAAADQAPRASQAQELVLVAGAFVLPHPEKMAKGGEDWFYISDSMRSIGVADGVGGWAEVGVDAGAYARQLMGFAREAADEVTAPGHPDYQTAVSSLATAPLPAAGVAGEVAPLQQTILERAYHATQVRGSSTACVLVLVGDRLLASNLGDSGFLVIRNGKVVFHAPQQQHDFNFPYQIGSVDSMSDPPHAAQRFELAVAPGDIIVVGTDGLWDNCFDEEITSVVRYCQDVSMPIEKAAQVLAHYARHRASDPKYASPFAFSALQAGYTYMGGKMDDITVLLARVTPASEFGSALKAGSGGNNLALPGAPKPKL